jgi:hypothetical protein
LKGAEVSSERISVEKAMLRIVIPGWRDSVEVRLKFPERPSSRLGTYIGMEPGNNWDIKESNSGARCRAGRPILEEMESPVRGILSPRVNG